MALSVLTLAAAAPSRLPAQATFNGCPLVGDARSSGLQTLNVLKNRTELPVGADIDSQVTLTALLTPGDDRHRWNERHAATLIGYVLDVRPGGMETVNCHARGASDRDTHIELVLDPLSPSGPERVIVEVTPRIRALMASGGLDWSTNAIRRDFLGRWVRVTGWLFFDAEHAKQSQHTAPSRPDPWRATAWELHPVTAIETVPRPR
jgi:hypothetical protein